MQTEEDYEQQEMFLGDFTDFVQFWWPQHKEDLKLLEQV